MTTVIVPFGRPKGDIIRTAYSDVGLSDAEFEIEPEEINKGLRTLNAMMTTWPYNLARYEQPYYGNGLPEDASGLDDDDIDAITMSLAFRLAAGMGKVLSQDVEARFAPAMAAFRAKYASVGSMPFPPSTPHGAGTVGFIRTPYLRSE